MQQDIANIQLRINEHSLSKVQHFYRLSGAIMAKYQISWKFAVQYYNINLFFIIHYFYSLNSNLCIICDLI